MPKFGSSLPRRRSILRLFPLRKENSTSSDAASQSTRSGGSGKCVLRSSMRCGSVAGFTRRNRGVPSSTMCNTKRELCGAVKTFLTLAAAMGESGGSSGRNASFCISKTRQVATVFPAASRKNGACSIATMRSKPVSASSRTGRSSGSSKTRLSAVACPCFTVTEFVHVR